MPEPTNWPPGWTERERVQTVALDRNTPDDVEEIAEEAGVDVETAREVINQMTTPDYSDTRWTDSIPTIDDA